MKNKFTYKNIRSIINLKKKARKIKIFNKKMNYIY